jgi:hypothetical protein
MSLSCFVGDMLHMAEQTDCATPEELERMQRVARRYCTCGWLNPLRVGKPECDAHHQLAVQPTFNRMIYAYRLRAKLVHSEFA